MPEDSGKSESEGGETAEMEDEEGPSEAIYFPDSHQQEKHPFSKKSTRAVRELPEEVHRHQQGYRHPRSRLFIFLIPTS